MATKYQLRRVYDDAAGTPADGYRVFVDKLWPRGLSKEKFHYDLWAKQLAPSDELRQWFHADREGRWDEFARRYADELRSSEAFAEFRREMATHPVVTLLYGSRDALHNQADVIYDLLTK